MTTATPIILAVDDEPGILKVYEDSLRQHSTQDLPRSSRASTAPSPEEPSVKWDLMAVESGEAAVQFATRLYDRGGRLTACFMDMRMPGGIDGLETVRRLRELDPRILVTFVTAYQDRSPTDIANIFGEACQDEWDYLNKPFTRIELLQKARNMVAGWTRRRENEVLLARLHEANEDLRTRSEELEAARSNLLHAEKMGIVGRMAAGVAHELNNPLTSVIGYAHLALRSSDLNRERTRIERVAEQAARAAGIVKNLLAFARKGEAQREHLGLNGIIEKAIELREYELSKVNIAVRKDLEAHLPKTMLDHDRIQQVLVNLLVNAEQAIIDAGSSGAITISTRTRNGQIEIAVSDDGPGIPEDLLGNVFEPFFTTKAVGHGTGLGLSICYGIVQDHGGVIRAENRPGGGARFIIRLPILQAGDRSDSEARGNLSEPTFPSGDATAAPEPSPAGAGHSLLRILLVDDEPIILDFGYHALRMAGYEVVTAMSGERALEQAAKGSFDIVVTDIKMPRMDGFEFARRLADQNPDLADRILFITGAVTAFPSKAGAANLHAPFLRKPFTPKELLDAVARHPAIRQQVPVAG